MTDVAAGDYILAAHNANHETRIDAIEADWASWNPSFTNMTQGNGTVSALWTAHGKTVFYRMRFVLGSTSSVGTGPEFSLPVAVAGSTYNQFEDPIGDALFSDVGIATRRGVVTVGTATSRAYILGWSATGIAVIVESTVPHTWGTSDILSVAGVYRSA